MNETLFTLASLRPAIVEIALASGICLLLLVDSFAGASRRQLTGSLALLVLATCA